MYLDHTYPHRLPLTSPAILPTHPPQTSRTLLFFLLCNALHPNGAPCWSIDWIVDLWVAIRVSPWAPWSWPKQASQLSSSWNFASVMFPRSWWGGGDIDIPLRVEHSTATYSWHFDQLYVSALLPIAKKLYLCKKHYFLGEDVLFYLFWDMDSLNNPGHP